MKNNEILTESISTTINKILTRMLVLKEEQSDLIEIEERYIEIDKEIDTLSNEVFQFINGKDIIFSDESTKDYIYNELDSILNEANVFYSKAKVKKIPAIMIRMDDEEDHENSFIKSPYIGIYDGSTFNNSRNMVRIDLRNGNLLDHSMGERKKNLGHLPSNAEQIKLFKEMLISNEKTNAGKYKNMGLADAINKYMESISKDKNYEPIDFSNFEIGEDLRSKDHTKNVHK